MWFKGWRSAHSRHEGMDPFAGAMALAAGNAHGYDDQAICKILGGNLLRLLTDVRRAKQPAGQAGARSQV